MAKLQIGAIEPLELPDSVLAPFKSRVDAGEDAGKVIREYYDSIQDRFNKEGGTDNLQRELGLNTNQFSQYLGQLNDVGRDPNAKNALTAYLRGELAPTVYKPGSLETGKTPEVMPGTAVPVKTPAQKSAPKVDAYRAIVLANGREVNYDLADPTIRAQADAGKLKIKSYEATGGGKPLGAPGAPTPAVTGQATSGPGAPATPVESQTPPGQPTNIPQPPATVLQPGMRGEEVKKLQDYLVSIGAMTREQVNTGYGIYGPQTTAAVLALQQKLGVDNSSGPGYFGPRTISAIQNAQNGGGSTSQNQQTQNNQTTGEPQPQNLTEILNGAGVPVTQGSSLTEIINELAKAYGLEDITAGIKALDDDYADDVAKINDDPWLSEGLRVKKIQKLEATYDLKRKQFTDRLALNKDIIGQAINLFNAEKDDRRAQVEQALDYQLGLMNAETARYNATKEDPTTDMKEYQFSVSQGYTGSFSQWQREQANLKATSSGSGGGQTGGGSGSGSKPSLTATQVNTGATNLGVSTDAFKGLNGQVQTWALSDGAKNFMKAIEGMKADVKDESPTYNTILNSINNSIQPQAVKDYMTNILDSNAPQYSGASNSGDGLWNSISNFFVKNVEAASARNRK